MKKRLLLGIVLTGLMHMGFAGTPTNVTDTYMKNYSAPFAATGETLIGDNARWQILASPWITEGDLGTKGVDYTAWHVDFDKMPYYPAQDNTRLGALTLTPGWDGFAGTFNNMKVYQTVTLPAASYEFTAYRAQDWNGAPGAYLVAAAGKGIPNIENLAASSLGSTRFNTAVAPDWKVTVYFKLNAETEVSLGAVASYTDAKQCVTLSDFTLLQILGANYNPLNNIITKVKGFNTTTQYPVLGTYAEAQWNALQTAITAADAFVAAGTDGTQEQVDAHVTAINGAVLNLDSLAALPIIVYKAKQLNSTQYPIGVVMGTYPQAAWDTFKSALQVAETFIAKPSVTAAEIETNTTALQSAISALNGRMNLPFKLSNASNSYWYQIRDMRETQSWWQIGEYASEDGTSIYPFALIMTQTGDYTLDEQLFKFVKAPAPLQGYYIYSKLNEDTPLNGSILGNVVTINTDSVSSTWQLGKTIDPTHFTIFLEGDITNQLNSYASYTPPYIAFYYPGDGANDFGNNWEFIEALTAGQTDFTSLKTLVAKAVAMTEALYPVGTSENEYPAEKWAAFVAARNAAVDLVTKETSNPQPTQTEVDTMVQTLQTAIDEFKASQNPPIKVSTATESFWYWIHDKRDTPSWWKLGTYAENPGRLIMIKAKTLPEEQKTDSLLFKFVKAPAPSAGYYIYSKLDEVNALAADEGGNYLASVPEISGTPFKYTPSTNANYYLIMVEETLSQINSYAGPTPPYIAFYDGGAADPGNNWAFIPAVSTGVKNVSVTDYGVYAVGRRIIAMNPDTRFEVYSINGQKIDARKEVNPGIYIVKVNGKPGALKLMVR